MQGRVLVVDDEKNILLVIQAMLEREGFEVVAFGDSAEARRAILDEEFDLIVTDLFMPGLSGMDLLASAREHKPQTPVVLVTAFGTVENAVGALKLGAFDFITKPFDQTELLNVVQKAISTHRAQQNEPTSMPEKKIPGAGYSIIGQSTAMLEVSRVISKVAPTLATLLVSGESGTGKELVAFEVHRRSTRAQKPFIKINCGAIPRSLIESELFGYERGAFTGAITSKPGRFELAHEGTLFLDEVAEMPLEMQVKLLRVLQEQEFERVGGVSSIRVDVRFIAATNKNLEDEVRAGRFREDLFYRLNVVPIELPPLRARPDDIVELTEYFLKHLSNKFKKPLRSLDFQTKEVLSAFTWPGNIRQLENILERMVLMSEGEILTLTDIPEEILETSGMFSQTSQSKDFKETVRRKTHALEKDLIGKALEETKYNVTRAAERLGLSRKGLQIKMRELGLKRPLNE